MKINNGNISTATITLAIAILGAIIADPYLLQGLMGEYYLRYGAVALAIMVAVYNALCPRPNTDTE